MCRIMKIFDFLFNYRVHLRLVVRPVGALSHNLMKYLIPMAVVSTVYTMCVRSSCCGIHACETFACIWNELFSKLITT